MAESKKKKTLSIRVSEELNRALHQRKTDTGVSFQHAVIDFLHKWAKGTTEPQPIITELQRYPEPHREWHRKLEAILASGDTETIDAVTQNVKVFFDRLRPATARRESSKS